MQQWQEALEHASKATRCTARTRQGIICKSPAMANGKCRMHGGSSTGAPCGKKHGRYKHGRFTKKAITRLAQLNKIIKDGKAVMQETEYLLATS